MFYVLCMQKCNYSCNVSNHFTISIHVYALFNYSTDFWTCCNAIKSYQDMKTYPTLATVAFYPKKCSISERNNCLQFP